MFRCCNTQDNQHHTHNSIRSSRRTSSVKLHNEGLTHLYMVCWWSVSRFSSLQLSEVALVECSQYAGSGLSSTALQIRLCLCEGQITKGAVVTLVSSGDRLSTVFPPLSRSREVDPWREAILGCRGGRGRRDRGTSRWQRSTGLIFIST